MIKTLKTAFTFKTLKFENKISNRKNNFYTAKNNFKKA